MTALGIDIGGTSVKVAGLRDGSVLWTGRSGIYDHPDREQLISALREAATAVSQRYDAVGLCVPGLLDRAARAVTLSVNVPGLTGQPLAPLLAEAFGAALPAPVLLSDARAAAHDLYTSRNLAGRLLLLAIGTGVGAAVLDAIGPLDVDGNSPGHFGQLDVSLDANPPIGPDGGAGGLEAYLGAGALRLRYGKEFPARLQSIAVSEPPLLALARAIRIGHALYRPHHVCLAGGIGNAMRPMLPALREQVSKNLTNIARADWTLTCGDSDYHAALGAAKLAATA